MSDRDDTERTDQPEGARTSEAAGVGQPGRPGGAVPPADTHVLDQVYAVVRQRQAAGGSESYVATLTARGLPKVRSKVLEEAGELLEASVRLEAAARPATAAASEAGATATTAASEAGATATAAASEAGATATETVVRTPTAEAASLEQGGERADPERKAIVHEAADLLFHALVLLGAHDVPVEDVWAELRRRFGVGGLVEKSARSKKQP